MGRAEYKPTIGSTTAHQRRHITPHGHIILRLARALPPTAREARFRRWQKLMILSQHSIVVKSCENDPVGGWQPNRAKKTGTIGHSLTYATDE
jgi:hypothetical protein